MEKHIQFLEKRIQNLLSLSDTLSWVRVGLVLGLGLLIVPMGYFVGFVVGGLWLIGVGIAFGLVVRRHRRVLEAIRQLQIWQGIQRTHLARLNLDWEDLPPANFSPDATHPFENDLDVTGTYSLHRLLDTCTTQEGSQTLRDWLLITTPTPSESLQRQAIVRELQAQRLLRDKLSLRATNRPVDLYQKRSLTHLLHWVQHIKSPRNLQQAVVLASGFALLNFILLTLNLVGVLPLSGNLPSWCISGGITRG